MMKRALKYQQGVSLIELMIAGVISLLASYFVMSILITTNQTASKSATLSQAQETGRYTISWLESAISRAGYNPSIEESVQQKVENYFPFATLCPVGAPLPPANNANCTFESSDPSEGDRIAVNRHFSETSDAEYESEDCVGNDLSGRVVEGALLTDVFWVDRDTLSDGVDYSDLVNGIENYDNPNAYDDILRCVTYDENGVALNDAATLASGIEGLQAIYGEATTDARGDMVSLSYVSANNIQQRDFSSVTTVKLAILTRSFSEDPVSRKSSRYILLDADPYLFNDGVIRQILSTTINLYNYKTLDTRDVEFK